jgi:hypothetical protein
MITPKLKQMIALKKLVNRLPDEPSYLIRYNYILPIERRNKVTQLTTFHTSKKQDLSVLFRLMEDEENKDLILLSFFEIIPNTECELNISISTQPTIIIERFDKQTLFQELLPNTSENNSLIILDPKN